MERKNGEKIPVEVSSSPINNHKGKMVGNMASFVDRTDKYRFKKGLRKAKEKIHILSSKIMEAEENQKRLIARELHDGVGSSLTAVKFALEEKVHSTDKKTMDLDIISLEQILSMIRDTIEEIHRISTNLRPSVIDDMGLVIGLNSLFRELQEIHPDIQIKTQVDTEEEGIPESLKIVIFRILQEALNNVFKYSQADNVRVALKKTNKGLELCVEDNGIGFIPEEVLSAHGRTESMGLSTMKERTELSHGKFEINSRKQKGTTIRAVWPV
jgi:signal transduction histidine kinase